MPCLNKRNSFCQECFEICSTKLSKLKNKYIEKNKWAKFSTWLCMKMSWKQIMSCNLFYGQCKSKQKKCDLNKSVQQVRSVLSFIIVTFFNSCWKVGVQNSNFKKLVDKIDGFCIKKDPSSHSYDPLSLPGIR